MKSLIVSEDLAMYEIPKNASHRLGICLVMPMRFSMKISFVGDFLGIMGYGRTRLGGFLSAVGLIQYESLQI
jgi:hypothetical protein